VAVAATMDLYDCRRSGKTAEELGWFEWPPACDIWNKDEQESACEWSCIVTAEASRRPEKSAALRGHLERGALAAGITYSAL